jgi:hypothetical protein
MGDMIEKILEQIMLNEMNSSGKSVSSETSENPLVFIFIYSTIFLIFNF